MDSSALARACAALGVASLPTHRRKPVWGSSYPTQEQALEAAKRIPEELARHERIGDLTFG